MGLEKQGAKPTGILGALIGKLMNKFHTNMYVDYFKNKMPVENSKILDIGCGGGKFLNFLAQSNTSYTLYGLDHSSRMISLAEKINRYEIEQNRVTIFQSTATNIPLESSSIDLVTAFETVQFWEDIKKAFSEIARVLKKNGRFIIINRYPRENSYWWKIAQIKNDVEYMKFLKEAGLSNIITDLNYKKNFIIVNTNK